jgi:hypothetical protein
MHVCMYVHTKRRKLLTGSLKHVRWHSRQARHSLLSIFVQRKEKHISTFQRYQPAKKEKEKKDIHCRPLIWILPRQRRIIDRPSIRRRIIEIILMRKRRKLGRLRYHLSTVNLILLRLENVNLRCTTADGDGRAWVVFAGASTCGETLAGEVG